MTTDELLEELNQEVQITRCLLERVPDDRLEWRPHPRAMTLGQVALHLAMLPSTLVEPSTWDAVDVPAEESSPSSVTSTAELLETLARSVARATARLGGADDGGEYGDGGDGGDDSALPSPWRMVEGDRAVAVITRGALLRSSMLDLWYHRGQLAVYLGQLDASIPPIYGDRADEWTVERDLPDASHRIAR